MSNVNVIQFAEAAERFRHRVVSRALSIDDPESWHLHYAGGVDDLWIGRYARGGAKVISLH